jgi:hypothetical protein
MSPETIYSLPLEIKALFDEALQDAKRSDSRGGEKITEEELDDIATRFNLNKKDIIDYTKGGLSCFRDEIGLSATKTGAIVEIETGKGREQLTPREKQLFTYF